MALHPDFPLSPYAALPPALRWFPAAEELRATACETLPPPPLATFAALVTGFREFQENGG